LKALAKAQLSKLKSACEK